MGYRSVVTTMDAKRAFCPGSTGKLTNQLLIKDHMISHYKKVYSAKSAIDADVGWVFPRDICCYYLTKAWHPAAVDCSVPKSMQCSVKYRDQKRCEQMKKDGSDRVQSVSSLSQRSTSNTTSCSFRNVRPAANGEESALFYSGGSALSSPRFNTSFPSRQIVYPSQIAASPLNCRPASELSYRSPRSQRLHFTQSSATSSCQEKCRSFQDPTQKTYSGDILLKHAHHFTQEKPFTPRTLKTHCKSNLSTYRYYTPPKRKEEKTQLKCNQDSHYESKHSKSRFSEQDFPKPYSVDPEWSDEETNISRHYRTMDKSKDYDFFLSSSRVSPEGMKSPIMKKVTAEEEELMYLEFVTDVTNEIIARGIYSDRVLKRVFERHIEINKQRLNEDKMRHLLDALQNDLQSPPSASVTVLKQKEVDSSVLFRDKYSSFAQELDSSTTDPTLHKGTEEHKDTALLLDPDPVNRNILHEATLRKEEDNYLTDMKPIQKEGTTILQSTKLDYKEENVPELTDNPQPNEEDKHQNNDELVNELDELGRNMAESLNLSDSYSLEETTELETSLKLSDDEF